MDKEPSVTRALESHTCDFELTTAGSEVCPSRSYLESFTFSEITGTGNFGSWLGF